jgi:hypothetical protein
MTQVQWEARAWQALAYQGMENKEEGALFPVPCSLFLVPYSLPSWQRWLTRV